MAKSHRTKTCEGAAFIGQRLRREHASQKATSHQSLSVDLALPSCRGDGWAEQPTTWSIRKVPRTTCRPQIAEPLGSDRFFSVRNTGWPRGKGLDCFQARRLVPEVESKSCRRAEPRQTPLTCLAVARPSVRVGDISMHMAPVCRQRRLGRKRLITLLAWKKA